MTSQGTNLFCFGLGFTGSALVRALQAGGWTVAGTCREQVHQDLWGRAGVCAYRFDGKSASPEIGQALAKASHVLVTIPPHKEDGDVVLRYFRGDLARDSGLRWLGYLSTTGVYGNRDGEWVDESSELRPVFDHQKRRAEAELQWLDLYRGHGAPVHVFRLAGIYGSGRNLLERVGRGVAKRIDQPGLVFNRIHVDDVVQTLAASMEGPHPGAIYNVVDDVPAAPAEAVAFACELLNVDAPPLVPLDDAGLSEMGRGFYLTNKKVRNRKIKEELGVTLRYPDYRSGLRSLLENERKG